MRAGRRRSDQAALGFSARTTINRKAFGLNWSQVLEAGGVLVGENIEITLDVQAVAAERVAKVV